MTSSRLRERLIATIVLAALLFSPPLILVVDRPATPGLSWLPWYLLLAWGFSIGLVAWLMERRPDPDSAHDPED